MILTRNSDISSDEHRIKTLRNKSATATTQEDVDKYKEEAIKVELKIKSKIYEPKIWVSDVTPEKSLECCWHSRMSVWHGYHQRVEYLICCKADTVAG